MSQNEAVGEIECAHCKRSALVSKYRTGRRLLYYHCKNCGVIQLGYPGGQDWILSNARMYGPDGPPKPAATASPAPPKVQPAPQPLPKPPEAKPAPPPVKRKGWLEDLLP